MRKTRNKLLKVLKEIMSKKKLEEERSGMFIDTLSIDGFRCFPEQFCIDFNCGLNVLVGENGSGKTAVISALRQLFIDSESGRYFVTERDFYKGFSSDSQPSEGFSVKAGFDGLGISEKIAFLPWCDITGKAILNLQVDNKEKKIISNDCYGVVSLKFQPLSQKQLILFIASIYRHYEMQRQSLQMVANHVYQNYLKR